MGIGPVPSSKAALKAADKQLADMEICEVPSTFIQYTMFLTVGGLVE